MTAVTRGRGLPFGGGFRFELLGISVRSFWELPFGGFHSELLEITIWEFPFGGDFHLELLGISCVLRGVRRSGWGLPLGRDCS